MALIKCKECSSEVSEAALLCPRCGISNPGLARTGTLIISRKSGTTGFMYSLQVVADGKQVGDLKSGVSFTLDLPAGEHAIQVAGGGLSKQVVVTVVEGQVLRYQTYFSAWGLLGGGLNLRPE